MQSTTPIIFLWENFGPMHVDRCTQVALDFPSRRVFGIELFSKSVIYEWDEAKTNGFKKITLLKNGKNLKFWSLFFLVNKNLRSLGFADYFFCHYEYPVVFLNACVLRLMGRKVFTMNCTKFDDKPRNLWREILKYILLLPYSGGIASGIRSKEYMEFLGVPRVVGEYNTLSINRIKQSSKSVFNNSKFEEKPFISIARFVPKKNLEVLLEAFSLYLKNTGATRILHMCGSGELEGKLREKVEILGISQHIKFHGFLQTNEIAALLGTCVALLLPSIEEQFGNVVIEAQALGVPAIVSINCGARDFLIRNSVNGFITEPDNIIGLAWLMEKISENETSWNRMSIEAEKSALLGDVSNFSGAIKQLLSVQELQK